MTASHTAARSMRAMDALAASLGTNRNAASSSGDRLPYIAKSPLPGVKPETRAAVRIPAPSKPAANSMRWICSAPSSFTTASYREKSAASFKLARTFCKTTGRSTTANPICCPTCNVGAATVSVGGAAASIRSRTASSKFESVANTNTSLAMVSCWSASPSTSFPWNILRLTEVSPLVVSLRNARALGASSPKRTQTATCGLSAM